MAGLMPIILGSGINRVASQISISSNTSNYVLNTAKVTGYAAGTTDVTLTINSGVIVSSSSTGSYAFTVDTSWTTGDTVTVVNNGVILGRGGNGGSGAQSVGIPATSGTSGGPALLVQRATSINNANRISGGGGGGGGGGFASAIEPEFGIFLSAAGGQGGGGIGGGSPNGSLTAAGSGSAGGVDSYPPFNAYGGSGGNGGTYGSSGSSGGGGSCGSCGSGNTTSGAGGGAAGAAVVGNSNITWIATGTRNGSIS